jgi:hypothetical protein
VARLILILVLLAVMFWVFSVVDCAVQPSIRHRGVRKWLWVVIVVVFPVLGGILWFAVGRTGARAPLRAPDDDAAFLRTLSGPAGPRTGVRPTATAQSERIARNERIKQLEDELARLDKDVVKDLEDDFHNDLGIDFGGDPGARPRNDPDSGRDDPDGPGRDEPGPRGPVGH